MCSTDWSFPLIVMCYLKCIINIKVQIEYYIILHDWYHKVILCRSDNVLSTCRSYGQIKEYDLLDMLICLLYKVSEPKIMRSNPSSNFFRVSKCMNNQLIEDCCYHGRY